MDRLFEIKKPGRLIGVQSPQVKSWRISVPSQNGEGWAIAFLDETGCLSILSDWGNYGYRWSPAGLGDRDFRSFLLSCNSDYIQTKLAQEGGGRTAYNGEKTLKAICSLLKERYPEEADAHIADLVDSFNSLSTLEDFWECYHDHEALPLDSQEFSEVVVYEVPQQLQAFMQHAWPRLREAIDESRQWE